MSRQVQQNLLAVGPGGLVQATFPGGVQVPEDPNYSGSGPGTTGLGINWVRQSSGAVVAYAVAGPASNPSSARRFEVGALSDDGTNAQMNVAATSSVGPLRAFADVFSNAKRNATVAANVNVTAGVDNAVESRVLLDKDSSSSFLQGRNLIGVTTIGAALLGGVVFNMGAISKTALFLVGQSGYSPIGGVSNNVIQVDGVTRVGLDFGFSTVNEHHWMGVVAFTIANLAAGNHTITFVNTGGAALSIDGNDRGFFAVVG